MKSVALAFEVPPTIVSPTIKYLFASIYIALFTLSSASTVATAPEVCPVIISSF